MTSERGASPLRYPGTVRAAGDTPTGGASCAPFFSLGFDHQHKSTRGDMNSQRQIPCLGPMRAPQPVDDRLVCLCRDFEDALLLSLRIAKRSQRWAADRFGIQPAQLSRILAGNAHFSPDWIKRWDEAVGNTACSQYIRAWLDGRTASTKADEIAELEHRLAELKAGA